MQLFKYEITPPAKKRKIYCISIFFFKFKIKKGHEHFSKFIRKQNFKVYPTTKITQNH